MSTWDINAPLPTANKKTPSNRAEPLRESFDGIYLDLSKQPGRCRFAEGGLGWKPSAGGETFTLDSSNITQGQWSRASRGYELRVFTKNTGIIQLDGFQQEVGIHKYWLVLSGALTCSGFRASYQGVQDVVQHQLGEQGACSARLQLGQGRVRKIRAII